jgi:hypothetical protein
MDFFLQTGSCYAAIAGHELMIFMILLPLSPVCWDYRHKPTPDFKYLDFKSTLSG